MGLDDLPQWLLAAIDNPNQERKETLDRSCRNWKVYGGSVGKFDKSDCIYVIYRELRREKGIRPEFINRAIGRMCSLHRAALVKETQRLTVRYARKGH
jgi:hypothetical protein